MVYADVPEHAEASQPQPRKPRSAEEWLEQISGQLQDLVDGIQQAIADTSEESDDDPDASPTGDGNPDSTATPDQGDGKENTARKTAAAKRAEVKGD